MPKQTLFLGTAGNDGTGDTLRQAGEKINYNFDEVYSLVLLGLEGSGASLDSGWRDFVLNVLDSSSFVNSDEMVNAITTGTFGINSRIDSIDGQLLTGSQWYIDLQSSLQVEGGVDSSFVTTAVSEAESRLETLIQQDSNGVTVLAQAIDSVSAQLNIIDEALGIRIGANTSAISTLSTQIVDSAGIIAIQSQAIDSINADLLILRNIDSDIIEATTVNADAIDSLTISVSANSDELVSIASRTTALENGVTVEINSDTIADIQSTVQSNLESIIGVNSDGIELVNQRVTTLEGEIDLIDSNFVVNATADARETLRSNIIASVDSGYSVLNTKVVSLEGALDLIDLSDSDIISITASARETLQSNILSTVDSDIAVLNSKVVLLEGEIDLIDSNFVVNATANARETLQSNILDTVDSDLAVLNSKVVTLEGALEVSGRTDSDIINVTAAARDALRSDILYDADSGAITLLNQAVTTLEGKIDLKPDSGDITSAVSNATTSLTSLINANDSDISATSAQLTSLSNAIDLKPDSGDITSAVSNATTSLTSVISAGDSATLVSAASLVTNLQSAIGDDIANAVQGLVTTTTLNNTIDGLDIPDVSAKYFVNLDVNNHFAGFELNNTGLTSDFILTADKFKFVTANTNQSPFSISGNDVLLSNATVTGSLDVKSSATGERMEIKNNKIEIFDNNNSIRVRLGFLG